VGISRKFADSLLFWLSLARDRKVAKCFSNPNFRDRLVNKTSFEEILSFCRQPPLSGHEVEGKQKNKGRAEEPKKTLKRKRRVHHCFVAF
jgi:hypothetical protein